MTICERCCVTAVVMTSAVIALVWFILTSAHAQDIHHHEGQSAAVDRFYSTWMMPDRPAASCCNKTDCYPTEIEYRGSQLYARRREDGQMIPVPASKIERNRDNPDGRNHICAPPPTATGYPPMTVFCFSLGSGT